MTHPAVRDLFLELGRHPAFTELLQQLPGGKQFSLSGLTTTAKAIYTVLLSLFAERNLIVVVDGSQQAETLLAAINIFHDLLVTGGDHGNPQMLPALDVIPMQGMSPHAEILEERAVGLWRLAARRVPITVLPVAAALLRIESGAFYRQLALRLRIGDEVSLDDVVAHLESIGYERREPVEMPGEYSVRGGILDVFSPEAPRPVRVDLFGDQVEGLKRFDVESQRSVLKIEDCLLLPLSEYQKSRSVLAELGARLQQSGISVRDLPTPGEPFPGWELLLPMVRPRNSTVLT